MWQRFTERARRVVFFAQEEATSLGDNYVSTEHLLLGLLREEDSAGAQVLANLGVSLPVLRQDVHRQVARGEGVKSQDFQLTPRAKRVVDLSFEEARSMSNNFIGSEHLLLGLIRERESLAARVLATAGVELGAARTAARALQSERTTERPTEDPPRPRRIEPPPPPGLSKLQPKPGMGDLGTLQAESLSAPVSVAADEAAFAEMLAVLTAKDYHGYRELLAQEKMTLIAAGTEAKMLRPERGEACQVRILSGEREGQAGWVLRSHFHYTGPDTRPFPPPLEDG